MIGTKVAETLHLRIGDSYTIHYVEYIGDAINESSHNLSVVGIIDTE